MFELQELSVIRQGLDLVTISGSSARKMVALQDKVEKAIITSQKAEEKKVQELQNLINK
tara:strand:+ start:680 stop:856 length:177 start_codon:yes stop_codon:yes gene_type:complete